jgi:similar to stage IV sporulation protein
MNWLYHLLLGYYSVQFVSLRGADLLDMTLKKNIPIWGISLCEDGVCFRISRRHLFYLDDFSSHLRENESVTYKKGGLLRFLELYGKRWGFALGLLIFFFSLYFSTLLVWSVEVRGNVNVSEEDVVQALEEMGLAPGVFISSVDPAIFSLDFQVRHDEFSFVSLNMIGTRAIFTVREREVIEKVEPSYGGASNIVSDISGKVVRYEILSGTVTVKRGEIVPQGALLISGVVENQNGTFKTVKARGRVFAETRRFFEVTVPMEENLLSFTGREETKRAYEFLGLTFSSPNWDKGQFDSSQAVESRERMTLFGRDLPIVVRERVWCETEEKNKVLTVDSARKKAYDKYDEYKRETFAVGYEILEEKFEITQDERGLTLRVEIGAVEDIARSLPFTCS